MMAISNPMTSPEPIAELVDSTVPAPVADPVPSPETPPENPPADPTPTDPKPDPTLYETPDGRQVDAETLQREWKDNFLPEFTRKSRIREMIICIKLPPRLSKATILSEWKVCQ